jgi:hypothetical protein
MAAAALRALADPAILAVANGEPIPALSMER